MTTRETTLTDNIAKLHAAADQLTKPITPSDFQARVIGLLAFEPDFETYFNYRVFPQGEFVNGERNDNVSEETGLPLHRVELEVCVTDANGYRAQNQTDPFWYSVIGVFYCEDLTDVLGTLTDGEPDDVWGLAQGNNTYRSVLDIPTPIHPTRGSNDPQNIGGQSNVLPIYRLLSDAMLTYLDAIEDFPAEWTRTFTTEVEGEITMSKTISQLQTSAFDAIANSMNTAAKEAGFENPRITFIYGVGTEDVADQPDNDVDCLFPLHVTIQLTEGYAEPQSTYYSVTGTTYCIDRQNVVQTIIGDLDDLKVNTAEDAYDYSNHVHHPVIDALAEALGYFFDETQLPYHWHRVFETA